MAEPATRRATKVVTRYMFAVQDNLSNPFQGKVKHKRPKHIRTFTPLMKRKTQRDKTPFYVRVMPGPSKIDILSGFTICNTGHY